MKRVVSCYSNSYGPPGVQPAVEGIARAGLQHVELALRGHDFGGLVIPESAVISELSTEREVENFLGLLQASQVTVSGCNVGGADLRTTEGFELTARRIRFAHQTFQPGVVVSGAGPAGSDSENHSVIDHLKRLGDLAGELGMLLTLETHKGPTQNARAMIGLMTTLDHPAIRLNFDTGNIAYYNQGADPVVELEAVKTLVGSVHLKDNRGGFEDWYFPAIGDGGAVNFLRVREILDGVGFAGPYTIEIEGIGGEPESGPEVRHDRVVRSVHHLRNLGYFD